ncbi:MAG: type II secretion system protein N [Hydrogenophaga sp.]
MTPFERKKAALQQGLPARWPAFIAGLIWLLAGLNVGYWALRAAGRSPDVPLTTAEPSVPLSDTSAVARALGAADDTAPTQPASFAEVSRYSLLGVVDQAGDTGTALIALDDQAPRPYRVGAVLEEGLVLQAVTRHAVRLGPSRQGPATVTLSLPSQTEH